MGGSPRVDREAGVIRGVKLIGLVSSNGRIYPPETLKKAAPMYEGKPVNINHPKDPDDPRATEDRFGVVKNARFDKDGVYGDIYFLRSHPLADRICEAAERPEFSKNFLGCSHNATGDVEVKDGKSYVTRLDEIKSVDLVADSASTTGLFESRQRFASAPASRSQSANRNRKQRGTPKMGKLTLREAFDRMRLLKPARAVVSRLLESGAMDPDAPYMSMKEDDGDVESSAGSAPTDDPASPDMDPEAALRGGFRSACQAVLSDTTLDLRSKISRLKELLTAEEKLLGSGQEMPEQEDGDHDEDDKEVMEGDDYKGGDEEMMEAEDGYEPECRDVTPDATKPAKKVPESKQSLRRQVAYLKAERHCQTLCRENGVTPTAALLEAMAKVGSDARRLELLEPYKAPRKARTSAGGASNVSESRGNPSFTGEVRDAKDFCKALGVNVG